MDMLSEHAVALSRPISIYHEFLYRYSNDNLCIYGFVEGKDDPSFYRGAFGILGNDDLRVDLWPSGNKDAVLELYDTVDWNRFPKNRVLFFVDRDLSFFLDESISDNENLYVTKGYSIENDIVNRNTCERVLLEVCNFHILSKAELDVILDLFESELAQFKSAMVDVMARIISWRKLGYRPCLNDILMKHMFKFDSGKLVAKDCPKGCHCVDDYIHSQCGVPRDSSDLTDVRNEFVRNEGENMFIRGKYLLWFLVAFVLNVKDNVHLFSENITGPIKMSLNLAQANAIVVCAPRASVPASLRSFLVRNYASMA